MSRRPENGESTLSMRSVLAHQDHGWLVAEWDLLLRRGSLLTQTKQARRGIISDQDTAGDAICTQSDHGPLSCDYMRCWAMSAC